MSNCPESTRKLGCCLLDLFLSKGSLFGFRFLLSRFTTLRFRLGRHLALDRHQLCLCLRLCYCFFLRIALAMTVGAEVLGDHQVLPSLLLLPLRDLIATGLWIAGFAGNTIVWRGEHFTVKGGKLST